MGLSQQDHEPTFHSSIPDAGGPACAQRRRDDRHQEKIRSGSAKPRRPDRAVYVPRALRSEHPPEETKPPDSRNHPETVCPKSPGLKDKSQPTTPRKSLDKTFCNVYTPPHLRNQRSQITTNVDDQNSIVNSESVPSEYPVPNSIALHYEEDISDADVGDNFYIGDYYTNGQLGLYNPYYDHTTDNPGYNLSYSPAEWHNDVTMDIEEAKTEIIDYTMTYDKDEDVDEKELKRASQEINRSSKRIIKQSFDSDVLVISDPTETPKKPDQEPAEAKPVNEKPKLEPKVSVKREENDWDAVFDDTGECLDPSLLEELTATVGKVHISKTRNNYEQYQTKGQALFNGPYDESLAHVVEVYDFPNEFKTNDLLSVFSEFKDTGFEIKWVDDTHALIVFSSAKIAAEVLAIQRPLVRCRPLHAATLESRNKAKKCAEFLQPYSSFVRCKCAAGAPHKRTVVGMAIDGETASGDMHRSGPQIGVGSSRRQTQHGAAGAGRGATPYHHRQREETPGGAAQGSRVGRVPDQPANVRNLSIALGTSQPDYLV